MEKIMNIVINALMVLSLGWVDISLDQLIYGWQSFNKFNFQLMFSVPRWSLISTVARISLSEGEVGGKALSNQDGPTVGHKG